MRDKRFVAVHRGGLLTKEHHYQLINWARQCAEHVLPLLSENRDERLHNALKVASEWAKGNASVGDARKASLDAIAVTNGLSNPTEIALARAVGHAVATAHMADHSLRAAEYALKAVKNAGKSVETERIWQEEQLLAETRELILLSRKSTK